MLEATTRSEELFSQNHNCGKKEKKNLNNILCLIGLGFTIV